MEAIQLPQNLKEALEEGDRKRFAELARDEYGEDRVLEATEGNCVALLREWVADTFRGQVTPLKEWLGRAVAADAENFGVQENDFAKSFWERPQALYHATQPDRAAAIAVDGLECRDRTRGICNRRMGGAVFTSLNMDELLDTGLGSEIFRVDTAAMKRDGFTPHVFREPDVEDAEHMRSLAARLGCDDFEPTVEHGISEETVILRCTIPAKYLALEQSAEPRALPTPAMPPMAPSFGP